MIAIQLGRSTLRRVFGSRPSVATADFELVSGRAARALLEQETTRRVGMSVDEFQARLRSGELQDSPDVAYLSVLTGEGPS